MKIGSPSTVAFRKSVIFPHYNLFQFVSIIQHEHSAYHSNFSALFKIGLLVFWWACCSFGVFSPTFCTTTSVVEWCWIRPTGCSRTIAPWADQQPSGYCHWLSAPRLPRRVYGVARLYFTIYAPHGMFRGTGSAVFQSTQCDDTT